MNNDCEYKKALEDVLQKDLKVVTGLIKKMEILEERIIILEDCMEMVKDILEASDKERG